MKDFEKFYQLHYNDELLLIGNVWDVGSAKIFEANGFKALATSSAALANALGYKDGQQLPFELLLEIVTQINKAISIPLSVDLERGYADTIPGILKNVEALFNAGVVGINIEDSLEDMLLRPVQSFQAIISAIAEQGIKKNMPMFINARTDSFLLKQPAALEETIDRAKAYEVSGAHGLFVPYLDKASDIEKIVAATALPVSVFFTKQLPDFKTLSGLGIKRISMGASVYRYLERMMGAMLEKIKENDSASPLFTSF